MNKWTALFALVLAGALIAEVFTPRAQSAEPTGVPFVGVFRDGEGHWAALRANGEVYVSEGTSWLDRMEYRYTIRTLEEAYSPDK
jgi:hypothetical protein